MLQHVIVSQIAKNIILSVGENCICTTLTQKCHTLAKGNISSEMNLVNVLERPRTAHAE